jgi:hypothetical protein
MKVQHPEYEIVCTRTRTSAGYASITIKYRDQLIVITNEGDETPEIYEQKAREIIAMIHALVIEDCEVPQAEA